MDNILINFTSDASGLKPGIDGLIQMKQVDQQLGDQLKKTAAEMNNRDQAISASTKASKKDVEGLVTAFGSLGKSAIGAAYTKTLNDIKNALNLTDKQLKAFYQNIKTNSQAEILKGGTAEELESLKQLIQGADKALDELGKTTQATDEKSRSFRLQLKDIREELQRMEAAGLEGTTAFERLQISAGQLEDQIGDTNARIKALSSDTFVFDAIASGVTGLTGAFTAAQGAAALFGDENEDLQRALVKVNGAMALLQGIQAVVNVLQKQSAASIAIDLILRRNQAAATTAVAVAEGEVALATEGATVATGALNAVMAINPAVLLVTAIAALAGAVYYFSNSEEDASKNAQVLNDALLDQLDINKKLRDSFKDQLAEATRGLENELAYAEKSGKSAVELGKIRAKLATQRALIAQEDANANSKELDNIETYRKKYEETLESISQLKEQVKATPGNKKDIEEEIKALQSSADVTKEKYDQAKAIATEYHDSVRDLNIQNLENEKLTYEQSVKSAVASVEARLAAVKKGSKEERDLQIAAINARIKAETDPKLNRDLTPGERAKIFADGQKQIQQIHFDYQKRALVDTKVGIDAQLEASKAGTKEEFDLKLQSLAAQRDIELKDQELTDNKRREIMAKFFSDSEALSRSFNKKVAEDSINQDIAETQSKISRLQLAGADQTNDQLLALKKQLVHDQAELEAVAIRASEDNENLKAAKIKAIYDKELGDKRKLEQEKAYAEITQAREGRIQALQSEIDANNESIEIGHKTAGEKRQIAMENARNLAAIARQEDIEADSLLAAGAIGFEEYEQRKTQAAKDGSKARIDLAKSEEEIKAEKRQYIEQISMTALNGFLELQKAGYEDDLARFQDLYDKKQITQKEFEQAQKNIRRAQAQAAKEEAIFDIFLQTARNIAEVAPNPVLIALAAGLGALQTAAVLAKPLPQYRHGKIGIEGPGSETSDSILARLSKGESVINSKSTSQHRLALEAINTNKFEEYLVKHEIPKWEKFDMLEMPKLWNQFDMPAIPQGMEQQAVEIRERHVSIDYDKLAGVIAQKLQDYNQVNISMDEDGFTKSIHRGIDTIEIKNKRLLM